MGVAIRGWKSSTTAGYASSLRRLADLEETLGEPGNLRSILSRKLAQHIQNGGSSSGARGIISAVRACEDFQLVAGVVKPLHWRLAKGGAQAGVQQYASPVMLPHLVDRTTSDGERAVVAMALVSYVCFLPVAEVASVRVGDVRDSSSLVFWNSKTGHEGWQRRYCLGSGLLLNGFTNGLRDEGALVTTCCSRQEPLSSRKRWRTWCMGQLGPDIDGIASYEVGLRRAGKGDRPYLTSSGGASGQQRRQQWRRGWGTGMKRLWPHSACHRFGVPHQRQLSWIHNKCGATSCSMSGTKTRIGRYGDGARDAEQRPVCSAERGLQGNRDPMQQTLVAPRRTRDQEYQPMKGRVSVRACEGLQRLFHRQRHEGVQEQDTRWGTLMSEGGLRILPLHCLVGNWTPAMRQVMGNGQSAQEVSRRSSSSLPRRQVDPRRHQRRDRGD